MNLICNGINLKNKYVKEIQDIVADGVDKSIEAFIGSYPFGLYEINLNTVKQLVELFENISGNKNIFKE